MNKPKPPAKLDPRMHDHRSFNPKLPVLDICDLRRGDRLAHKVFGLGNVIKILHGVIVIKFDAHGEKEMGWDFCCDNIRRSAKTKRFYGFYVSAYENDESYLHIEEARSEARHWKDRFQSHGKTCGPIFAIDAPMPRWEK